ncbi:hypothetical protein EDF62_0927 [Leucobacter luti]|uniref:Uncharacterized protein n=1 Tax=Leucobacter luti TaxID=340320 RepID=A0A4V3CYK6_9MICO|nr:hypothetical protein EDF62_0927 [Leucobacter luti]
MTTLNSSATHTKPNPRTRFRALLCGGLLVGMALRAPLATSTPASAAGASPWKTRKQYSAGKLRATATTCYSNPRSTGSGCVVGHTDSVSNGLKSAASGSCVAERTKTVTSPLSARVGVEASAWIFAKASASVSGGRSNSRSTGSKTSVSLRVPAKEAVTCTRGVVAKSLTTARTVPSKRYLYDSRNRVRVFTSSSSNVVRGTAPNTAQWRLT